MCLLSDAAVMSVWPTIKPYLTAGKALYFSHGFAITWNDRTGVVPPADIDVIMVAPKGSGTSLRTMFLEGRGLNSSYAIYQDATGKAYERTIALGIGIGSGYLFETTFQREATSDLTGERGERLAVPGTYLIHFTSVGKSPVQKEFSISANRRNVDLGKILIAEATEMLKGVEVVAQKPLVKAEIDKVTYSIEDDPDSKTNTTLEMLRKVPLVTVDGEDKIQVNGSSKFKVHVNGKPNNMMSNNPTEVLRSMPANSIKSIEVITEPGAKYDAEGVAGILNIITVGAGMEGYTVTLNGGASNMRVYGGGYGTVQSGKFTVTGNYSYNYQGSQKGFEDSYREDFTSQENKFLESHRRSKSYGNFQFGSLEGSYEIDTLNLISFSMNLMTGNFTNKRIGNTQMTNHAGNPVYGYGSLGNNESGFGEVGATWIISIRLKRRGTSYFLLSF